VALTQYEVKFYENNAVMKEILTLLQVDDNHNKAHAEPISLERARKRIAVIEKMADRYP
jgi:hypothetical protein